METATMEKIDDFFLNHQEGSRDCEVIGYEIQRIFLDLLHVITSYHNVCPSYPKNTLALSALSQACSGHIFPTGSNQFTWRIPGFLQVKSSLSHGPSSTSNKIWLVVTGTLTSIDFHIFQRGGSTRYNHQPLNKMQLASLAAILNPARTWLQMSPDDPDLS